MVPDIMNQVAGDQFDFVKARLFNYFRSRIDSEEYPAIIPQQGADVLGIVYRDINAKALNRLDLFEGKIYDRSLVEVSLTEEEACQAMAYLLKPEFKHILTNQEWSYDNFLLQGKVKFLQKYTGFQEIEKTV